MSDNPTLSFDRMRSMLMRAAEIRDSEQQQIFDSLDEIHARLAALDALGTVRKRLAELPDRNEVSVLAERLDETVAKLDAQDGAIAALARSVESITDRFTTPFAQLDGRLDGVAGRMEGVSGRMEGLDDRLAGLHKRLDDIDNRLDRNEMRLDGLPGALTGPTRERIDVLERSLRESLDGSRDAVQRSLAEAGDGVRGLLGETWTELHGKLAELGARPAVDPSDRLDTLTGRLEALAARIDAVEDGVLSRIAGLASAVDQGVATLADALGTRPDRGAVEAVIQAANQESERRSAGQLDEAMATFAELILGRGAYAATPPMSPALPPPMAQPRPTQRRSRSKAGVKATNGIVPSDETADDPDD